MTFILSFFFCTAANLGDGAAPLNKLVRVLNNQLNALMQLEAQTEELSENGLHALHAVIVRSGVQSINYHTFAQQVSLKINLCVKVTIKI